MAVKADILLESGTNELGILEFSISGYRYGINVAKVKEIMKSRPINPMQKSNEFIEGVFKPRDEVITVVNLAHYLGLSKSEHPGMDVFIITNFSQETYAFHVHEVVGISRISWNNLKKPDDIIYGQKEGIATAIAEYEGRLITVLDFEKIVGEINPNNGIRAADLSKLGERRQNHSPIMVVEDSATLSKMVREGLSKAGFTNVAHAKNGQEALDLLTEMKGSGGALRDKVACLVTDIEMPEMDGHHLIKKMKEDEELSQIPIVILSSLINDDLLRIGKQLGAHAQFAKPDIVEMIKYIDALTS